MNPSLQKIAEQMAEERYPRQHADDGYRAAYLAGFAARDGMDQWVRWVKLSDQFPVHSKNLYCKDEKGNKRVAFYTLGNTYHIELDDDQDLEFIDKNNFLIEGWYEWVETPGGIYDMQINPVTITEYLYEPPKSEV